MRGTTEPPKKRHSFLRLTTAIVRVQPTVIPVVAAIPVIGSMAFLPCPAFACQALGPNRTLVGEALLAVRAKSGDPLRSNRPLSSKRLASYRRLLGSPLTAQRVLLSDSLSAQRGELRPMLSQQDPLAKRIPGSKLPVPGDPTSPLDLAPIGELSRMRRSHDRYPPFMGLGFLRKGHRHHHRRAQD